MKNSKVIRLALGIVILFGFFIFQGSHDENGCAQCESDELGGELTVINNVLYPEIVLLGVRVLPDGGNKICRPGESVTFYLNKGTYQVITMSMGMYYTVIKILSVNMITINTLSSKTIEIK